MSDSADSDTDENATARTSLLGGNGASTPSKNPARTDRDDVRRHAKFASARAPSFPKLDYKPSYHLGILLSLHLSTFWLLDSLKDPILTLTTGIEHQPTAKIYSIAFTLLTTCVYNLFQTWNRNKLFHALLYMYSGLFLFISAVGPTSSVLMGYLNFLLTESYGSLITAHFWGFCNAHLSHQDSFYPIIIGMAQIGAILGGFGASGGDDISRRYFVGGCLGPISVSIMLYIYESKYSVTVEGSSGGEKQDVWRGLKLIRQEPYLHLVFLLSTVYEVTLTVLDYLLKLLSIRKYSSDTGVSVSSLTTFLGGYAVFVNLLSFLLSVFVFERLLRRLGFKMALTVYPCLLVFVTLLTFTSPSLWLVFVSMGLLKSLAYSVNDPLKELLYGVTTTEVKFGCKSWIDVLGSRIAKGVGSMLTGSAGGDERKLVQQAALPCLVAGILLAGASVRVGEMREEMGSRKVGEGAEGSEGDLEYEVELVGRGNDKDDKDDNIEENKTEDLLAV